MQGLQFKQGCRDCKRKTRTRVVPGVVEQVLHQVREILVAPKQFDLFRNRRESIQNNIEIILKVTHGAAPQQNTGRMKPIR